MGTGEAVLDERAGTPATTLPRRRRRQIGSDRREAPNPAVPRPASGGALALGRLAIIVTLGSWAAYVATIIARQLTSPAPFSLRLTVEAAVYLGIVTFLCASAVAYLLARQGYLRRTRRHVRTPRAELEGFFEHHHPTVTALVPSYREQREVIRQTLLSAALQECPSLRVVLLIDDPPSPEDPEQLVLLEQARAVPGEVAALLAEPRDRYVARMAELERELAPGDRSTPEQLAALADDYEHAVAWLRDLADGWVRADHTDDFLVDHVLLALAHDLDVVGAALRGAIAHRSSMSAERMLQLERRLARTFSAELTSFERKQYLSLSHEPNKAMNLNAYIGLMGATYSEQVTSAGTLLLACEADDPDATLTVPDSDYLLTLDADSTLLPEYCLRLLHRLEQPEGARIGVLQTPYSAYPGAPTRVERLAGATTDLQHIVHQGMAEHDAAYWVGANALLRVEAVRTLQVDDATEGQNVRRFISDRTVIEDTESTLDMTANGWVVENYPERLAYSASPPDFGSLCIQRQRWANGGLIIVGKLAGHWRARKARGEPRRMAELLLRLNYLASITWATAGLVLLLAYPFSNELTSLLVVSMSLPYFIIMATDLRRSGYKRTDVLRIYGFNLIMLPVNASGVLRSIWQLLTGHKVAFARTPKVKERVVAPATFVIVPYLIVAIAAASLVADIDNERWMHAAFSGITLLLAAPAIVALIGIRHSFTDVWVAFVDRLYRPVRASAPPPTLDPLVDWAAVLYHGSIDKPRSPHRQAELVLAGVPVPDEEFLG